MNYESKKEKKDSDKEQLKLFSDTIKPIHQAFNNFHVANFFHELKTLIAGIKYPQREEHREEDYQNAICAYLQGAIHHDKVRIEVCGNKGRSDIVIVEDSHVFVIELKLAPQKSSEERISNVLQEGLKQIKEKNYGRQYTQGGRPVALLCCVIFDRDLVKGGYRILEKNTSNLTDIQYI